MDQKLMTFALDLITNKMNPDLLEEPIEQENNTLTIITMEEDTAIIKQIWEILSAEDIDLMEYTLHSKMIEDEDGNFITTLTITFIDLQN